MAFQAGTQVDPRLLDYSGLAMGATNAANIQAAALADLGAQVGNAVEKFKENKVKKATTDRLATMIKKDPALSTSLGIDPSAEGFDEKEYQVAAKETYNLLGADVSKAVVAQSMFPSLFDDDDDDDLSSVSSFLKEVSEGQLSDRYKIDRKTGKVINRDTGKTVTSKSKDDEIINVDGFEGYEKLLQNPFNIEGLDFYK